MNTLLTPGRTLRLKSGSSCRVGRFLGGGGQGEVYEAEMDGRTYALKWYFPEQASKEQRHTLEDLIRRGAPSDKFLWPLDLVEQPGSEGFGYLMPLRDAPYKSIVDLMKRRAEPSFRALLTAAYHLVDHYLLLHAQGLCYRDISFGNVFFDPETGDIRICDNDNVTVTGQGVSGVLGTPRFMAPEIVRGEAHPSTETDLFSLSVLLFYMLMLHHPLEGRREQEIRCFDLPAMRKLYGEEPLFIWDPSDDSNAPVAGVQDNAILYWSLYPASLRDAFTQAFTTGLADPQNGRVRESEWRKIFARLRDSLLYCGGCGAENFYEVEKLQRNERHLCWACGQAIQLPPRIRTSEGVIMLNHDTKLFPHHLGDLNNFGAYVAEVSRHPQDPTVWGLTNRTSASWVVTWGDGQVSEVEPGRTCTIAVGTRIRFERSEGEIRL